MLKRPTHKCLLITLICVVNILTHTFSQVRNYTSPYIYIYKLSNTEIDKLFTSSKSKLDSSFFHTKVDSFNNFLNQGSWPVSRLSPGYYVLVYANKNYVDQDIRVLSNIRVKIISDGKNFSFRLYNTVNGNEITDAKAKIGNSNIPYNKQYLCYMYKGKTAGKLRIEAINEVLFYEVEKRYNSIGKSFRKKNSGYIAFNKPIYHLGDTLRLKAHITKNGKPINKEVWLKITNPDRYESRNPLLEVKLKPSSPGTYIYEFPLRDTLTIDKRYQVAIVKKKKKNPWNEKSYIRGQFKIEDYLLDEAVYSLRSEKKEYRKGEDIKLYAKATNANDLAVMDGRVKIKLSPFEIKDVIKQSLQLPHEIPIGEFSIHPEGETEIVIPADSVPEMGINYRVVGEFNNSNNETQVEEVFFKANLENNNILFSEQDSFITAVFYKNDKEFMEEGFCWEVINGDTVNKKTISFPYKFKPGILVKKYFFLAKNSCAMYEILPVNVSINSNRTIDSIFVSLVNPKNIEVQYRLYKNEVIIKEGFTNQLEYKERDVSDSKYAFLYNYMYTGESITKQIKIIPQKKTLDIVLTEPENIYPGQKARVNIKVIDFDKNPVKNADVLASSINAQFKRSNLPIVPDFNTKATLKRKEVCLYNLSLSIKSTYDVPADGFWTKELQFKNIAYYQLTHPGNVLFKRYIPNESVKAEFFPYVISGQEFLEVHMIYVDDTLVYYDDKYYSECNSIIASAGKHNIRIRTNDAEYILKDIELKNGQKLEFSFDSKHYPEEIKKIKKTRKLSTYEKMLERNCVFQTKDEYYYGNVYCWKTPNDVKRIDRNSALIFNQGDSINYLWKAEYKSVYGKFKFNGNYCYDFNDEGKISVDTLKKNRNKLEKARNVEYRIGISTQTLKEVQNEYVELYRYNDPEFPYEVYTKTEIGNGSFAFVYTGDHFISKIMLFNDQVSIGEKKYRNKCADVSNIPPGLYKGIFFMDNNYEYFVDDSIQIDAGKICIKKYDKDTLFTFETLEKKEPVAYDIFINQRVRKDRKEINRSYPYVDLRYSTLEKHDFYRNQYTYLNDDANYYSNDRTVYSGYRRHRRGKSSFYKSKYGGVFSAGKIAPNHLYRIKSVEGNGQAALIKSYEPHGNLKAERMFWGGEMDKVKLDLNSAMLNSSLLRENFTDEAYWQPALFTDEKGEVKFDVTFPDNITKWNSFAIAMTGNKSGVGFAETKASKPIMATLSMPRFLTEGDTTYIVGKALNYTKQNLSITTAFKSNNRMLTTNNISIKNSYIEKQFIAPGNEDTLFIEYSLRLDSLEYTDGEKEKLPVLPIGVGETNGQLYSLDKDTNFQISIDTSALFYELSIVNNDLDLLIDKITELKTYPHECNEQLASKLIALLSEKKIKERLKEIFLFDYQIRRIIAKLERTQNENGGWGWWKNSPDNYFMTIYITKALLKAEAMGYRVDALMDAISNIERSSFNGDNDQKVLALEIFGRYHYENIADSILKIDMKKLSTYSKYLLIYIKQRAGLGYDINEILKDKKETALGASYWGNDSMNWYNNTTQLSLLVYKILEKKGGYEKTLEGITKYFLEHSDDNTFRNTYESASILETILPGVLNKNQNLKGDASVTLNGKVIKEFPFRTKMPVKENKLNVSAKCKGSLYMSVYKREWNRNPQPKEDVFVVKSTFTNEEKPVTSLKAGKITTMRVEVTAKKKGDYVMIEIPIPAGCSYNNKDQSYDNNEVHREYFKDKVSIFCEKLPAGKYQFDIELQPRYNGTYNLNPAHAELMYFPAFNGRNELKKVRIED